jgi:hypothetical protein
MNTDHVQCYTCEVSFYIEHAKTKRGARPLTQPQRRRSAAETP